MNWFKLLISIIIFQGIAVADDTKEVIKPDGEIEIVQVIFHLYRDVDDLRYKNPKNAKDADGFSECWRLKEKNTAQCDIHVVRPKHVDDYWTMVIGHEVMHGIYGPGYHYK